MAETDAERKKRETLDALRRNQTEIPQGEEGEEVMASKAGDSGQAGRRAEAGGLMSRRTLKLPDTASSPAPAASPSPSPSPSPSVGAAQAAALKNPPASAKTFDTMSMEELAKEQSLPAKAVYNRRLKTEGKK